MGEFDLLKYEAPGYAYESPQLDMEIYRLVSSVAASSIIAQHLDETSVGRRWRMLKNTEFPEICRILVSIAAIIRNRLDLGTTEQLFLDEPVGLLWRDASTAKTDREPPNLTLREACNKLLHAEHANPDLEDPDKFWNSPLRPHLHLYGTHRGTEWKALLDIYAFAIAALQHT